MRGVLLMFILIPIIEMVVLIKVGGLIGVLPTIALVLLTAIVGVSLLRQQGGRTLMSANTRMRNGEMPVGEMGEGLMLAVAGALLLTPGFVTDVIGFLLLTPGVRQHLLKGVSAALMKGLQGNAQVYSYQYRETYRADVPQEPDVIEGEFREVKKDQD